MNKILGKFNTLNNLTKNFIRISRSKKEIKQLKDAYRGSRCFIVGSGPSLRMEDLEKIKHEKSFGTHRIYQIFDKTEWRPSFYCAQDMMLINDSAKSIENIASDIPSFIGILLKRKYSYIKNAKYLNLLAQDFYPNLPDFSENISSCVIEGGTVTYMCLQLAVYLGFSEIYLIGIDHNYSSTLTPDGKIEHHEGVKDHFSDNDVITNTPVLYKSSLAYEAAQQYAIKNGIKIYNATRGGKLEAFERVNFDDIYFS